MKQKNKLIFIAIATSIFIFLGGYFLAHKKNPLKTHIQSEEKTDEKEDPTKAFLSDADVAPPFPMPDIPEIIFPKKVCNISNYGAVGDGQTKNTESFKKAIADCAKAGGGKVEVPKGVWFTGAIHLKSNINLSLDQGAEIRFSDNPTDYLPIVLTRFEGVDLYNYSPFIYGKDLQNVAITGKGVLSSQGKIWQKWNSTQQVAINKLFQMGRDEVPVSQRIFGTEKDALQPSFVEFFNCKNVLLDGISVKDSPSWTIHPLYSQNITIKNITVKTSSQNTDGIVIDSSENVLVENSTFDTGDDSVVIKSGRDHDGLRVKKPSQNIIIHDCYMDGGHSALAIGSEMSGNVKNVLAYNLDINYVKYGVRFKSTPGRGGTVENIWVENVYIHRATSEAIQIDMQYGTPFPGYDPENIPSFRNITIKNLGCRRTSRAMTLRGLPESPLENLTFKNLNISATRDLEEENLSGKNFQNVNIKTD